MQCFMNEMIFKALLANGQYNNGPEMVRVLLQIEYNTENK